MLRNSFVVSMIASLAGLLLTVDVAQAQMRERRMERRMDRRGVAMPLVTNDPMANAVVVEDSPLVRVSYYFTPIAAGMTDGAQIRVILPEPQARVTFDGTATTQMGTDRRYSTPPLTVGAANSYRVQATFMQNGREMTTERTVSVMPGRTYVLDFTQR